MTKGFAAILLLAVAGCTSVPVAVCPSVREWTPGQQAEAAGGTADEQSAQSGPSPDGHSDQVESPSSNGPSVGGSPVSYGA